MVITVLDVAVIVLVLLSAVLAMVRGFSREVLSIVSWVVAGIAAIYLYARVTPFVQNYISSELISQLVAGAAIFFLVLIVATLVTMRIADTIVDSRIGPLDRSLGFVFGVGRGVIVCAVAVWFLGFFASDREITWIDDSKSKPFLDTVANSIVNLLPEDMDELLSGSEETEA
ncbi:MAG: CvpA family protein [Pseudomonadota bacterium]